MRRDGISVVLRRWLKGSAHIWSGSASVNSSASSNALNFWLKGAGKLPCELTQDFEEDVNHHMQDKKQLLRWLFALTASRASLISRDSSWRKDWSI
jgi:hypothetical protein